MQAPGLMRHRKIAYTATWLFALAFASPQAHAQQVDTNPPLPNVMLLVDNSGSMEYMSSPDPTTGQTRLPSCNPGAPLSGNEQNRWATLLSVLTGEVQNFSCYPEARTTAAFHDEYALSGVDPYDWNYYLPFNRMVSGSCVVGPNLPAWPGAGATGAYQFPPNAARTHLYSDTTRACTGPDFAQTQDGLLDAFRQRARFGLMTFDALPSAGTGLSGSGMADPVAGTSGGWSYFPSWQSGSGSAATGRPELCTVDQTLEVGARNPAAPPWEGRLIPFGNYTASAAEVSAQNDSIQTALLMLRPYGATPTAGLFTDASYFFNTDPSPDPLDPNNAQKKFGPKDDPFVTGGCRKNFIVFLTDGQPNLDLRPGCANNPPLPNGTCPYRKPEEIIYDLAHPADPNRAIKTFVVGFAVSTIGPTGPTQIDCSSLTPAGSSVFDPTGKCVNPTTDALKACCQLGLMAYNGGTNNPHFADDKDKLRQALSDILSQISSVSTSRTTAVFANAPSAAASSASSNAPGVAYNFYSSFFASSGTLWNGVLERQRYSCVKDPQTGQYTSSALNIDPSKGDSFSTNVNTPNPSTPRHFYTIEPQNRAGQVFARQTIRTANPLPTDGLGVYTGTVAQGNANSVVSQVSPQTLGVAVGTSASTCSSAQEPNITPAECRNRVLGWELGLPVTTSTGLTYSRSGHVFGSIYHATPALVPPPSDFVRDESYSLFQASQKQKNRPLMLYTATTDGQMHAFKVGPVTDTDSLKVDTLDNNELWSFLPPGVLPSLRTLYPGVQQVVLDGAPVVRDVVLSRNATQAQAAGASWSTMLVAGFGSALGAYYALDVTNPVPAAGDATTGPQFKWQISTDETGIPLFGTSTTPAITSLFFQGPGQTAPQEVAVAILPGGSGSPRGGVCPRSPQNVQAALQTVDAAWPPRASVPCYDPNDPSRSVTIVRLDTGEVVRTFRTSAVNLSAFIQNRVTLTPFDSPMAGVPVTYPAGAGTIANRAFVGDKDGSMWRFDLKSTDPAQWTANLFFDAYSKYPADAGQPVGTPPVLSIDPVGNLVVLFSTGDQEQFSATAGLSNFVWSVREDPVLGTTTVRSKADWRLGAGETIPNMPAGITTDWSNGQRVTGPMALFNGVLYFSSYQPPTPGSQVCDLGQSVLWGVDYLQSVNAGSAASGPQGRLALSGSSSSSNTVAPPAQSVNNALIFGVGLTRSPSCYDQTTTPSDFSLGYGSATTISNSNPGTFQLVVQTGSRGAPATGGSTNTKTFALPTPPPSVRMDSWAAVVE